MSVRPLFTCVVYKLLPHDSFIYSSIPSCRCTPARIACELNQFRRHLSRKWGNMSNLGNIKCGARPGPESATQPIPTSVPPWDPRDHSGATLPQEWGMGMQKRKVHQGEGEGGFSTPSLPLSVMGEYSESITAGRPRRAQRIQGES